MIFNKLFINFFIVGCYYWIFGLSIYYEYSYYDIELILLNTCRDLCTIISDHTKYQRKSNLAKTTLLIKNEKSLYKIMI